MYRNAEKRSLSGNGELAGCKCGLLVAGSTKVQDVWDVWKGWEGNSWKGPQTYLMERELLASREDDLGFRV